MCRPSGTPLRPYGSVSHIRQLLLLSLLTPPLYLLFLILILHGGGRRWKWTDKVSLTRKPPQSLLAGAHRITTAIKAIGVYQMLLELVEVHFTPLVTQQE